MSSRRLMKRQTSASQYELSFYANDKSVVDTKRGTHSRNNSLSKTTQAFIVDAAYAAEIADIENSTHHSGSGSGNSGSGDHPHDHQQHDHPHRKRPSFKNKMFSSFRSSRHSNSNTSLHVDEISDCSSSRSPAEHNEHHPKGSADGEPPPKTNRRPSLKRSSFSHAGGNSGGTTMTNGSFRGLVKQMSWKQHASHQSSSSRHKVYNEYEHDDKFLDVCRLDEERSKLIGLVEEPNMIKLLTHWTGTIFAEIIYDYVFWATLLLYILLRIWIDTVNAHSIQANATLDTTGDDSEHKMTFMEEIQDKAAVLESLPIVGGFLTLFLVFFVNQNHARYYSLHESTMKIMGSICDLASLLASAQDLPIERARRINRYCNAAHVVMYAGLTRYLQEGQIVQHLTRDYALLTDEEADRMEVCGMYEGKASACFELLSWSLQDVNRALADTCVDAFQASEMRTKIIDFRSTVAHIVVTCLCPIPFFYVHFLSLLTAIYLPLFALMVSFKTGHGTTGDYKGGQITWLAEIVGFFLIVLQCLFVIGLRILGQQLGNPYGEDFIDMQITTYIIMVLSTSNRTLESMDVNDLYNGNGNVADPDTELQLKLEMVNLGDAWGIKKSKTYQSATTSISSSAYHSGDDDDDDDDDEHDENFSNSHPSSSNRRNSSSSNNSVKNRGDENSSRRSSFTFNRMNSNSSSVKHRDDGNNNSNSRRSSFNSSRSTNRDDRPIRHDDDNPPTINSFVPGGNAADSITNNNNDDDNKCNTDYGNLRTLMGTITTEEEKFVLGVFNPDGQKQKSEPDVDNAVNTNIESNNTASIAEQQDVPLQSVLSSFISCGGGVLTYNDDVSNSFATDQHSKSGDEGRQLQRRHSVTSNTSSCDQSGTVTNSSLDQSGKIRQSSKDK